MLGAAPHLDATYTLFGEIINLKEFESFKRKIEALPTRSEGIFVMPLQKVEVLNSFVLREDGKSSTSDSFDSDSDSVSSSSSLSKTEESLRDLKLMEARWKAERARRAASLP
jgi:hypothetical protein